MLESRINPDSENKSEAEEGPEKVSEDKSEDENILEYKNKIQKCVNEIKKCEDSITMAETHLKNIKLKN